METEDPQQGHRRTQETRQQLSVAPSEHTMETAGQGILQDMGPELPAPSCSEGFTTNNAAQKVFSFPPQEKFVPGT